MPKRVLDLLQTQHSGENVEEAVMRIQSFVRRSHTAGDFEVESHASKESEINDLPLAHEVF